MIGLDIGYFFRLAEKTDPSIRLLNTALEEEREVVVCTIDYFVSTTGMTVGPRPSASCEYVGM